MSKDKIEIKLEYQWKYGNKWPYNGMVNDLYRGIQAGENYLVALGLFSYSEVIGWEKRGARDSDVNGWECYKEFTENYVGYNNISGLEEVFRDSRNGLAHRYFIKNKPGGIINDYPEGGIRQGIIKDTVINIYIYSYFKDFVKGLEKYIDEETLAESK